MCFSRFGRGGVGNVEESPVYKERGHDTAVLALKGTVSFYQLHKLRFLFEKIKIRLGQRKRLILDLSQLDYMDPLALGIIVAFSKDYRQESGDIKIVNIPQNLLSLFEQTRLSKVYESYGSIEAAEKSFI